VLNAITAAAETAGKAVAASGWFLENAWLIWLFPAVSFLLILLFGKRFPRGGSEIGIAAVGASLVFGLLTAIQWISEVEGAGGGGAEGEYALGAGGLVAAAEGEASGGVGALTRSITWLTNGAEAIGAGIMIDGLAVMMIFVVTVVSLLVHVYSTDYVAGDRRYTHFFAFLSLFTASMLFFVTASTTLQMLVGWELVGVCSFVLIGHWWEEKDNSDAALKAFLTNRVGDMGLIIGVSILFFGAGTFDVIGVNEAAISGAMSHTVALAAALCLTAAVISKSGQFFLHTWLPDAMAGPTPVSALIHAATMVVAGIFMVARLYGVFFEGYAIGGSSINLLALIGGLTTLVGATLAFVQNDIKRVLAYSTVSQLGYMVLALGVGAWTAALFHLFTHAFFKACLFLGSGSVSHAVHSFDMKKDMGGLRKHMPHTYRTFLIASLALAGLPPLAGFWSKDEILAGTGGWGLFGGTGGNGAYTAMLVMVQDEVAERLVARPGQSAYGLPSLKVACRARAEILGRVPPTVFWPRPRVSSALLAIDRLPEPAAGNIDDLYRLARRAFGQRRKMLRSSLRGVVTPGDFAEAGVDPAARPGELGVADWSRLAAAAAGSATPPAGVDGASGIAS